METANQVALCPYLLPCNASGTEFEGYLPVLDKEFHVQIILEAPHQVKNLQLRGNWKLHQLLSNCKDVFESRLLKCDTIRAFVLELQALLEKELRTSQAYTKDILYPPAYYKTLLFQLEQCGWMKVAYVHPELSEVHFRVSDEKDREHLLKVLLPKQFPKAPISFKAELPVTFSPKWSHTSMFSDILSSFESEVQRFQHFWDIMDEIDCGLWVLEPEKPTRQDVMRRIAIKGTSSVQIAVNPLSPESMPECRFFGPNSSITPLQESFNRNAECWDSGRGVVENLELVLQTKFLSATSLKKSEFSVECGICYSYRFNECFPDVTCDGSNCGQLYHHICLYEWLRTLPSARQSFNSLFGECPYCGTSIVCKLP